MILKADRSIGGVVKKVEAVLTQFFFENGLTENG